MPDLSPLEGTNKWLSTHKSPTLFFSPTKPKTALNPETASQVFITLFMLTDETQNKRVKADL